MAYISNTHAAHPGMSDRTAGFIATLREKIARYRLYRETIAELGTLSTRELADLGLHRSAIKSVAYEAAYNGK